MTSGFHEDSTNRAKIAELVRFNTSNSGEEQISLKEYVDRMKDGQNDVFCMTGESIAFLSSSLFLEKCRKKGLEVLYMVDPVKNSIMQKLKNLQGKMLKSATQAEWHAHATNASSSRLRRERARRTKNTVHVLKTRFDEFVERKFVQANRCASSFVAGGSKLQKRQEQQQDKLLDKLLETACNRHKIDELLGCQIRDFKLACLDIVDDTRKSRSVVKFKYLRQFAFSFVSPVSTASSGILVIFLSDPCWLVARATREVEM